MPTYKEQKPDLSRPAKRFFHIHIPRTAGRYLDWNFMLNGFQMENNTTPNIEGVEVQHLHRDLYEQYLDVAGIPHISVVRNPIDRFISCSIFLKRMYGDDIQDAMEDENLFYSMLENFPFEDAGRNWFRSQIDFITSDTHLWKFEDGFGDDFCEWVGDIIGVKGFHTKSDVPYPRLTTDESKKLKKSAKLVNNIKSLYRQDIEHLYPELATPFEEGT